MLAGFSRRSVTMKFRLTRHAEWEMARRGIPLELVQRVIDDPEQRVVDESGTGRWIYQSRLPFEDATMYLLRVVVDEDDEPPAIVTVYRTSKIVKYWRSQ
jgi:SH3-like domain-containing protein